MSERGWRIVDVLVTLTLQSAIIVLAMSLGYWIALQP